MKRGAPSQAPAQRNLTFTTSDREVKPLPNIKSAKKRVKVIETKTLRNKMLKTQLKTEIKKFEAAVASGDVAAAKAAYVPAVKRVDRAVALGLLHKNNAAHKKSGFTKMIASMESAN
jgi:small subunit ribosomal protein S20